MSTANRQDAITEIRDIEAYRLGLNSGLAGHDQDCNPYPTGDSRTFWFTGWYEAKHQLKFGWKPRWK